MAGLTTHIVISISLFLAIFIFLEKFAKIGKSQDLQTSLTRTQRTSSLGHSTFQKLKYLKIPVVKTNYSNFSSRKWYYGASAFFGQLMPDIIKFGITGIVIESFSYREILKNPLFYTLDHYTGYYFAGYFFWSMLSIFSLLFFSMLVSFKFIKKKRARQIVIFTIIFSISAIIHLILDILIIEKNPWI